MVPLAVAVALVVCVVPLVLLLLLLRVRVFATYLYMYARIACKACLAGDGIGGQGGGREQLAPLAGIGARAARHLRVLSALSLPEC